jgi:hypothetical protein
MQRSISFIIEVFSFLASDIFEANDTVGQILSDRNDAGSSVPTEPANQDTDISGLQENVLHILGFEPTQKESPGPPIHSAIKPRWMDILSSGLSDDIKAELVKKYVLPANLPILKPPLLNPEVKAALPSQGLRRDERLMLKQGQLSACIAGLGRALTLVLSEEGEKSGRDLQLIEFLSDSGRLLCNYYHSEMSVRKDLILVNLNKDLRDVLAEGAVENGLLFGDCLEERLKAAKNLEKAGLELRQAKPKLLKRPSVAASSLNLKGPTRPPRSSRAGHVQSGTPYQRLLYQAYHNPNHAPRPFPQGPIVRRPALGGNQDQTRHRLGRSKGENSRRRH